MFEFRAPILHIVSIDNLTSSRIYSELVTRLYRTARESLTWVDAFSNVHLQNIVHRLLFVNINKRRESKWHLRAFLRNSRITSKRKRDWTAYLLIINLTQNQKKWFIARTSQKRRFDFKQYCHRMKRKTGQLLMEMCCPQIVQMSF